MGWNHLLVTPTGDRITLFDHINQTHWGAVEEANGMADAWQGLQGLVDEERFNGVAARFAQQVNDGAAMSKTIMGQYSRWAGRPVRC